jgi:hypothetical protein
MNRLVLLIINVFSEPWCILLRKQVRNVTSSL